MSPIQAKPIAKPQLYSNQVKTDSWRLASKFLNWSTFRDQWLRCPKAKNLEVEGKRILITGGSEGIGLAACIEMAKLGAKEITICSRSKVKLQKACELASRNTKCKVTYLQLDLADIADAKYKAAELAGEYDIIIANAGVMLLSSSNLENKIIDTNFLVNHVGHFAFIISYLNHCKKLPSRIVMTTSAMHFYINSCNFEDSPRNLDSKTISYSLSKLANILFAKKLSSMLPKTKVHSVHPGSAATPLSLKELHKSLRSTAKKFMCTPKQICQGILEASFSKKHENKTNLYFDHTNIASPSRLSQNDELADQLWNLSTRLTKINLQI